MENKKLKIPGPNGHEVLSFHPTDSWLAVFAGNVDKEELDYQRIIGWALVRFDGNAPLVIGVEASRNDDYCFAIDSCDDFIDYVHERDLEKREKRLRELAVENRASRKRKELDR